MIAQCNSWLSVLPVARVQLPATAEYFKGFSPGWSHSANPSWACVTENDSFPPIDTIQPVDSEEEGQWPTMDSWWLNERNINRLLLSNYLKNKRPRRTPNQALFINYFTSLGVLPCITSDKYLTNNKYNNEINIINKTGGLWGEKPRSVVRGAPC